VIVAFAAFGLCGSGILGDGTQGDLSKAWSVFAAACDDESFQEYDEAECEREEEELEYAHIWSMPTYVDLRESVERLQETRDDFQEATAGGNAETVLAATREYQAAIQEVQRHLATLKKRVDSEDFACASQEFLNLCSADQGPSVIPGELGHLEADIWQ
jgi:hypothetical protein